MKLYIPAWHYRARAIAQRTWGWSPAEEMVLLTLDRMPGTINELVALLDLPRQVVSATIARLMQFGLAELRRSPKPMFATSSLGRDFLLSGRALPERTMEREVGISLVFEMIGHSVLRNRDVETIPQRKLQTKDNVIAFPPDTAVETDRRMAARVNQHMAGVLRPGEWFRGVQTINSVLEQKYLIIDLNDVREGVTPEGASEDLIKALQKTVKTGKLPKVAKDPPVERHPIEIAFGAEQLIVGGEEQLLSFERIVGAAKSDVFVLSTFVSPQNDDKGKEQKERVYRALESACRRGVRCHLFFGTTINSVDNAIAMQELGDRLSSVRVASGFVLIHRESVKSHVKILAADDGQGGVTVVLGSCNWLSSPFAAVEVSAELRNGEGAAEGLDQLSEIVTTLSSASRAVETLQFMAADLRRARRRMAPPVQMPEAATAQLSVLYADDHERLLRVAAHDALRRFICCTNKVGANMVPALFNPAEIAGRRLSDVRVYYSRHGGPVKRRHVKAHRERLNGMVDLIGIRDPQLHAKFLAWDSDHVVVSSLNWGSQSGLAQNRMDEVGIYLQGKDLASELVKKFEAVLPSGNDG